MATTPDSTTIPTPTRRIEFDRTTRDYAMHLDDELIGYARTYHEGEVTLDSLVAEILQQRAAQQATPAADILPLAGVGEALDELARGAGNPDHYLEARARLDADVSVAADGSAHQIDGVRVAQAPAGQRWPWPWRCTCGSSPCWHGALCDALVLAGERADGGGMLLAAVYLA